MKPKFLTPLQLEKVGEDDWILLCDLVFHSERYRGKFIAPKGSTTDLASIPGFAQSFFHKVGKQDKGAVIHDCAYRETLVTENGDRIHCIKFVADYLFLEGMIAEGVDELARAFMYQAVVKFGRPKYEMAEARSKVVPINNWSYSCS